MQRYEWEDALIDAQKRGAIGNGELLAALKLARAINWKPQDKRPAGLYWSNEKAFEAVGLARATWYRSQKSLIETGFVSIVNGNITPLIPEQSQSETVQSQNETTKSQSETQESQSDNTFSEDTLSEDTSSEESFSDGATSAPVVDDLPLASYSDDPSLLQDTQPGTGEVEENIREDDVDAILHEDVYPSPPERAGQESLEGPESFQASKETPEQSKAGRENPRPVPEASEIEAVVRERAADRKWAPELEKSILSRALQMAGDHEGDLWDLVTAAVERDFLETYKPEPKPVQDDEDSW